MPGQDVGRVSREAELGSSERRPPGRCVSALRAGLASLEVIMRQVRGRKTAAHIRAQGKLVIVIAAVLQTAGIKSMAEFAALLGTFAVVAGEANPREGEILAYWAAMVREGALAGSVDPHPGEPTP